MPFVPLHVTSSYSFLNSAIQFDTLILKLKKCGYSSCGITDLNTLFGYTRFNEECLKNNIKPLFGMDIRCENNTLSLYAINEDGYKSLINLSYIISKKTTDSQINIEELQGYCNNIACIICSNTSFIFTIENQETIAHDLKKFDNLFKPYFYIGLENHAIPFQSDENIATINRIRDFVKTYPYTLIAFPHVKYLEKKDEIIYDILQTVQNGNHLNFESDSEKEGDYYLKNPAELQYSYTKEEIENTNIISTLCNVVLSKPRGKMLTFTSNIPSKELLRENSLNGLKRLGLTAQEYTDRLNYELSVIDKMGYNDYFLIVSEYVNYAKDNDILVGPGRGSAAGSLVSYALNITEIDPIKYNLLFERFLNEERVSMPDIDVDFEDSKRDLIVEHLKLKYGQEKVSNITTIQTFQARQSVRDIGRVYDLNQKDIDSIAKLLVNNKLNLRNSYIHIPSFKNKVDSDKYFLKIVALASKIEGLPRQRGMHAAGVILNDEPIVNGLPIIFDPSINGNVSQVEMGYLEKLGYLKMDILGLTNLSTIRLILELIKKGKGIDIKFQDIPTDDPCIYDIINKNMTIGIFQLESSGMNNAINKIKPNCFNDIVSLLALFRPGPMDNIDLYARRKNNHESFQYISDDIKNILEPTYGIIIYQEQIMQIAQRMAGFSLSKADILRRAISKKKLSEIEKMRSDFIKGCMEKGHNEKTAIDTYNLIEMFASYGFNKSHSVAYAMITTRMAYLKAKFPSEFYIGVLASTAGSTDEKYKKYLVEIRERNIPVKLPDINKSSVIFVLDNNNLIMPFSIIKGLMNRTIEIILSERKTAYKDFFDFLLRTYEYRIGNDQLEKLIRSGTFDNFISNRETLIHMLPELLQRANLITKSGGQFSLFNEPINYDLSIKEDKLVRIQNEYELVGSMISDNPLKHEQEKITDRQITPIKEIRQNVNTNLFVIIKSVKIITTKKTKQQMAFITVGDGNNDTTDVTLFPTTYSQFASLLNKNSMVIISGFLRTNFKGTSFVADDIKEFKEGV